MFTLMFVGQQNFLLISQTHFMSATMNNLNTPTPLTSTDSTFTDSANKQYQSYQQTCDCCPINFTSDHNSSASKQTITGQNTLAAFHGNPSRCPSQRCHCKNGNHRRLAWYLRPPHNPQRHCGGAAEGRGPFRGLKSVYLSRPSVSTIILINMLLSLR